MFTFEPRLSEPTYFVEAVEGKPDQINSAHRLSSLLHFDTDNCLSAHASRASLILHSRLLRLSEAMAGRLNSQFLIVFSHLSNPAHKH